jgi:hypothetical protein
MCWTTDSIGPHRASDDRMNQAEVWGAVSMKPRAMCPIIDVDDVSCGNRRIVNTQIGAS